MDIVLCYVIQRSSNDAVAATDVNIASAPRDSRCVVNSMSVRLCHFTITIIGRREKRIIVKIS